ncbi:Protein TORNADO 1 [Asimina triloba]
MGGKLAYPVSRGSLRLVSADPRQNPSAKFNYLAKEKDLDECVKMVPLIGEVAQSRSISAFLGRRQSRLSSKEGTSSSYRKELRDLCKKNVKTIYYYHGGCLVGSVVDRDYRVFQGPWMVLHYVTHQVHLHNKIMGTKNQHAATYNLEKYLISITINGIYVRVELGGQLGYHIDVLACSTKNMTETLRLFQQLIIPTIQGLCHGVTLTESVLRSECVKNLTPPRYRRSQFVHLQQLKEVLLTVPAESMYEYQHTWSSVHDGNRPILPSGFDFARDLLSDEDFREVLHRRYNDLYHLANELAVPMENTPEPPPADEPDSTVEASMLGIAKGVEAVLQRLKIIQQEIKDLKQEIQGLRYYEHRLLIELHRKVNYMVNYTVQLEERKVPNMFYFVQTDNYSRKLVTNLISGMTALRLHMLCEFRREMHVVEDQMGCEMMKVDNVTIFQKYRCLSGQRSCSQHTYRVVFRILMSLSDWILISEQDSKCIDQDS